MTAARKTKHDDVVEQLDQFYTQAKRQILQNQSAITGLFPTNSSENSSASIKTSLWAASSIFALYLAYSKRVDNDKGKAHDLGQSVVKCMRGILFAWMRQADKVESFKANQSPKHALHLKFDLHSGLANDPDFPHLQIDVVSLYLIFLANFIASGLDIIYCMDEVTFIQNLVYYVERAYRTPDYGSWEPARPKQSVDQQHQQPSPLNNASTCSSSSPCSAATPTSTPINPSSTSPYISNASHCQTQPTAHHSGHPQSINDYYGSQVNYTPQQANTHQHQYHHHHQHNQYQQHQQLQQQLNQQQCSPASAGAGTGQVANDGRSLEIHATSIGMAKSALEAINGCNLFGGKGANWSIIYSDIDAHSRNRSIFETLLPRESRSKNTDSYLLATISWPCFATHDHHLYETTKAKVIRKLKGKYGFKRFLRDPYGTVLTSPCVQKQHSSSASHRDGATASTGSPTDPSSALQADTSPVGDANLRELSFSSTTSGCSNSSLAAAEPPRIKQRKSSYHQRKNIGTNNQALTGGHLLQRTDSATKLSKRFEHIESEWPLFVCFLIIDGIFKQDSAQVNENEKLLYERLLKIDSKTGDYLMPKYYYVPQDLINNEKCHPDSVARLPSAEGSSTDLLYLTGQSILLITRLLLASLVHPNELDPLRRHMPSHDRPKVIGRYSSFQATSSDLVVQTVLIAESIRLQAMMANYGIQTQTPLEVEPVQIWSSAQLVKVYEYLGVNEKLGLKGRPSRPVGALGTSKLYRICGQTILCYPLIFEVSDFYLAQDMLLLIDDIQNELNFIGRYWRMSGRPTVCILIREEHLRDVHFRDLLDLLVQFKNGQLKKSGLRIKTGRLQNLINASCIEHLDFLHLLPHEHLPQFKSFRQLVETPKQSLLNVSRAASFARVHHAKMSRRHLCSASSHNLQAIEEQQSANAAAESDKTRAGDVAHQLAPMYDPLHFNTNNAADPNSAGGGESNTGHRLSSSRSADELEQNYAAFPSDSIDYYECYKEAPTWPTLIEVLRGCQDLGGQSQLLAILWEREGAKYCVDNLSVEDRLEAVSQLACQARNWSAVRYCSAVLKRSVESLSPWLTSILVNGKQISLGTGSNEKIINNPLTPTEIHELIYLTNSTKNPCDAVLQQEIALYIGRLISTRPDYFEGILTIRVTNFMSAMRSYLSIKTNEIKQNLLQQAALAREASLAGNQAPDDQPETVIASPALGGGEQLLDLRIKQLVAEPQPCTSRGDDSGQSHGIIKVEQAHSSPGIVVGLAGSARSNRKHRSRNSRGSQDLVARALESLSPSEVRKLLVKVLNEDDSLPISDRRQITGELCRVPKDFYDKVWSLLSCTNVGIVIGGKILCSVPTLTNMTQDDLNFALKVESLLSEIDCPKLRQINVELLMALHVILERNPEIRFETDPLDLNKIINLSLEKFRSDYGRDDYGLPEYYCQPIQTTMLYTIRTVFDCLLPIKYKGRAECKLS